MLGDYFKVTHLKKKSLSYKGLEKIEGRIALTFKNIVLTSKTTEIVLLDNAHFVGLSPIPSSQNSVKSSATLDPSKETQRGERGRRFLPADPHPGLRAATSHGLTPDARALTGPPATVGPGLPALCSSGFWAASSDPRVTRIRKCCCPAV